MRVFDTVNYNLECVQVWHRQNGWRRQKQHVFIEWKWMWSKKGQRNVLVTFSFLYCCCIGSVTALTLPSHSVYVWSTREFVAQQLNGRMELERNEREKKKIDRHRRALRFQLFKNNRIGGDFSREWKRENEIHQSNSSRKCVVVALRSYVAQWKPIDQRSMRQNMNGIVEKKNTNFESWKCK